MSVFFNEPNAMVFNMAFETFVMNVLRDYLANQNKTITPSVEKNLFDALLPDGIDDLPGPIHLEVKYSFANKSEYFKSVEKFAQNACDAKMGAILFILGVNFTNISKQSLQRMAEIKSKRKVYVWDINDFDEKTMSFQSKYEGYMQSPTKTIVDAAINNQSSVEDVFASRSALLALLKKKYENEELVLFLGAGVSIDAGIPLWKDLINSLLSEMIIKRTKDVENTTFAENLTELIDLAYKNQDDSLISQMRYIRGAFDTNEYNHLVHDVLYKNNPKTDTDLLNALAEICTPKRNHIGVQGVVTYNFDDLFERKMKHRKVETNIISRDSDTTVPNKLSVFHVHGYMPKKNTSFSPDSELIFSEEDYHRIYRDAYAWSNIVQLNYLRESTGLFIGCSLTDPNLRRLLDVATRQNEKPRHFAFLRRNPIGSEGNIDPSVISFYESVDLSLREKYYASMGLNIIWIDKYEEITRILRNLLS